ncbi:hypothetical protein N183_26610 [Sinorhizobium sp. Sb3]|nr:hypothetical protein N183_26610 [Sinorhizobium sp. Sb3]
MDAARLLGTPSPCLHRVLSHAAIDIKRGADIYCSIARFAYLANSSDLD